MRVAVSALQRVADTFDWPEIRPADASLVAAVHGEAHVRRVAELASSGGGWIDPDTFVAPASHEAALCAAGAALQATADVLAGHQPNAFVIVRPPGHHAMRGRPMGFCLFNNAAIAADWAIAEGGARKVAILDVDVHHGNGTQEIFFDRADVFYYSTHQYPFYPGTGRVQEVGTGDGVGSTINVPLMAGCGDLTFLAATDRILAPALCRFAPDLVLVSLGLDAHWADPLAHMRLSLDGYADILGRVRTLADALCDGRLILILEGGYNLRVIEEGAGMVGRMLLGAPPGPDPLGGGPSAFEPEGVEARIREVCAVHNLLEPQQRIIVNTEPTS